jgi:hypothetical protein
MPKPKIGADEEPMKERSSGVKKPKIDADEEPMEERPSSPSY